MKTSILIAIILVCQIVTAQVTVFENPNFAGRSKILPIGTYRFLSNMNGDFNDLISSIKVPKGFSAVLFESADDGGGFGFSVDLLEDIDDLSKYNFNDKTSYISVFSTVRQGFIWVRGMRVNNQYMPAHWERQSASGVNPNAPTASVSPFIMSNIMRQQFMGARLIVNKESGLLLDVKGGRNTAGTQIWQFNGNGTVSQKFTFAEDGNGFFNILTKDQLYVSMKFNPLLSDGSTSSGSSRVLVQDTKYGFSPACNFSATANCSPHQSWEFIPVPNEPQTFIIRNVGLNQVLQSSANESGSTVTTAPNVNIYQQKWVFLSDNNDLFAAPKVSQADMTEYNDIVQNQMGVAILNGETAKPFYYHHNQPNEQTYKYKKRIDITQIPESVVKKATSSKTGQLFLEAFTPLGGLRFLLEVIGKVTKIEKDVDCWYPDSEFRKTLCGKITEDAFLCPQDQLHTELTIDLDFNFDIKPNAKFNNMLSNRWIGDNERFTHIEAEVRPSLSGKSPKNPLFSLKANQDLCVFGPWMADILDYVVSTRYNNEIHPINQMWYKPNANEIDLISVVDATGYFEKTGNNEVQANGLNQRMRYHIAFEIPLSNIQQKRMSVYQVNAKAFDATNAPPTDINQQNTTLKYQGIDVLQVKDNSFIRIGPQNHSVFFEKIRKRADGSIQGYIVIETLPITQRGGSINVIVNKSNN